MSLKDLFVSERTLKEKSGNEAGAPAVKSTRDNVSQTSSAVSESTSAPTK